MQMGEFWKKAAALAGKNRLIAAAAALGVLLLVWPFGTKTAAKTPAAVSESGFDLAAEEERLSRVLSEIDGAGAVSVMLTLRSDARRVIAYDSRTASGGDGDTQAVIVSTGGGANDVVTVCSVYPEYAGAVVVAEGAGSASVRLELTRAVAAATGLGTDRIVVAKSK